MSRGRVVFLMEGEELLYSRDDSPSFQKKIVQVDSFYFSTHYFFIFSIGSLAGHFYLLLIYSTLLTFLIIFCLYKILLP